MSSALVVYWTRANSINGNWGKGREMQDAVRKVQKLGVPPEGFEDNEFPNEDTIQIWEEWVEAVDAIERPVTWEEAEILIKCSPIEHMSGVEWTFLHCIESVFKPEATEDYRNLIAKCNSDMLKDMLFQRLQNYFDDRKV